MNLEGDEPPIKHATLSERPDLRYIGSNTRYQPARADSVHVPYLSLTSIPTSSPHSDLYVTVQVWAGSKALTVPVQTAYKAFRTERKSVEQSLVFAWRPSTTY